MSIMQSTQITEKQIKEINPANKIFNRTYYENSQKYYRNQVLLNKLGYMNDVYCVRMEDSYNQIMNKLNLDTEYISRVDQELSGNWFIESENEYIIYNGLNYSLFGRGNNDKLDLSDDVQYNCYQTCIMKYCGDMCNILENLGAIVVYCNYPTIYFQLSNNCTNINTRVRLNSDGKIPVITIEQVMSAINNDGIKFTIIDFFDKFYKYDDYSSFCGRNPSHIDDNRYKVIGPEAEKDFNQNMPILDGFLLRKMHIDKTINVKLSLYKKPSVVSLSSTIWKRKVLHECFNTDNAPVYAFFDIDIDPKVEGRIHWDEKLVAKEVCKFQSELYQHFKIQFDFAISYSLREDKISIHLVSTNVLINNLKQFKTIILGVNFTSLLGRFIDPLVYRNNGCLRVAGTYKETDNLIFNYDTLLKKLNYKYDLYQHFVNKRINSEYDICITNQTNYFKDISNIQISKLTNALTMNLTGEYSNYISVLDNLIERHFTYENCIGEYNNFFIFTYIVAAISNGDNNYKNKLLSIIKKEEDKIKNKTKEGTILYNFSNYKKFIEDHNLHNQINYLLHKYNILNLGSIISKNVNIKFVNSQYLSTKDVNFHEFVRSDKTKMFIKSSMGTGKTEIVMNFLKTKSISTSVLIVCTRKSMIQEFKKRLNSMDLKYVAINSGDNFATEIEKLDYDNITIFLSTCESLWKLSTKVVKFDILLLDEIESISTQMCSKTTHRVNLDINNLTLQNYLRTSKVISMDGLMTENIIKVLTNKDDNISLIYNDFNPNKEIKSISSGKVYIHHLVERFNSTKQIAIACDSKIVSISLYELLTKKKYDINELDEDVIIYNSDTSSTIDITSLDLNGKTIIYTPSMDVSVSITNYTPSAVFGFFVNSDVSIFSKIQMLMRFRNTKDIILMIREFTEKQTDDEISNEMLFTEYFDEYFNCDNYGVKEIFKHFKKLEDFKFQNIEKKEQIFLNKMKDSIHYRFLYHESFKKNTNIRKQIHISKFEDTEAIKRVTDIAYEQFKEIYKNNKEYFYLTQYLDKIINDITERRDRQLFQDEDNINITINNIINEYSNFNINSRSSNEMVIKALTSTIFFEKSYHKYEFKSIEDFHETFLSNNLFIKLFYNIVKSSKKYQQLFLYYILSSVKLFNGTKYIDLKSVIEQCKKIKNKYFQNITERKVKYASRKFFGDIVVVV